MSYRYLEVTKPHPCDDLSCVFLQDLAFEQKIKLEHDVNTIRIVVKSKSDSSIHITYSFHIKQTMALEDLCPVDETVA